MRALTNLSQARMSEKRIEDMTGLTRTPGSGCGKLFKGDNGNKLWHVEDKSTRQIEVRIQRQWIDKTRYQAQKTNKPYWALGISSPTRRMFVIPSFMYAVLFNSAGPYPSVYLDKSTCIRHTYELPIEIRVPDTSTTGYILISELDFVKVVDHYAVQNPD